MLFDGFTGSQGMPTPPRADSSASTPTSNHQPQLLNEYQYAADNPITNTDTTGPDGHRLRSRRRPTGPRTRLRQRGRKNQIKGDSPPQHPYVPSTAPSAPTSAQQPRAPNVTKPSTPTPARHPSPNDNRPAAGSARPAAPSAASLRQSNAAPVKPYPHSPEPSSAAAASSESGPAQC